MNRVDSPRSGKTTYHRDSTVTLWDCLTQSWQQGVPSDEILATCSHEECEKIARHCKKD